MKRFSAACACTLSLLAFPAAAEDAPPPADAPAANEEELPQLSPEAQAILERLAKLEYQTGDIALPGGRATVKLPEGFRYLTPKDAHFVLEDLWGNPPDPNEGLGMIVPAGVNLIGDGAWVVAIDYSDDGHVSDEDASEIDYQELLAEMQQSTRDANPARVEAGYPPMNLVGWAEPPHYDAAGKKLYWAKILRLTIDGQPEAVGSVNYDIRVLGREGYLLLSGIADETQLEAIKPIMQDLLPRVEFGAGHRYADFNPDTDRVAEYGIAALVAGTFLAKKGGLLAALGIALLKLKKLAILLAIAGAAFVRKLFKKSGAGQNGAE